VQHLDLTLRDLPPDVRALVIKAVRILIEGGPQRLVDEGLLVPHMPPQEAAASIASYISEFPGALVDLPESAELRAHVAHGTWEIDVPLYNDREGRSDLFMFIRVERDQNAVEVTDIYAP
jgi:hypothetical protein